MEYWGVGWIGMPLLQHSITPILFLRRSPLATPQVVKEAHHREIRNPNIEIRNKPGPTTLQNRENLKPRIRFGLVWNFFIFGYLKLFRISCFEFFDHGVPSTSLRTCLARVNPLPYRRRSAGTVLDLTPFVEYNAPTSAGWVVPSDETSIDSVLDVIAFLAVDCASCRGGAVARQYRLCVGEQQRAEFMGGAGTGNFCQVWR